ncbi:MAG: YigZ family protein, partial [Anaerolineales bacterium]
MTEKRYVPSSEVSAEIKISNSTFISTASPAFSVDEAKEFISQVRVRYSDATHNVPVYIIGHPPSVIEHSNDDGEPSGTAGRPALSILRGSGLGDIAVVITRYFGGTKLGTGGLVRAYSDSMRAVLDKIIRAEKLSTVIAEFTVPY